MKTLGHYACVFMIMFSAQITPRSFYSSFAHIGAFLSRSSGWQGWKELSNGKTRSFQRTKSQLRKMRRTDGSQKRMTTGKTATVSKSCHAPSTASRLHAPKDLGTRTHAGLMCPRNRPWNIWCGMERNKSTGWAKRKLTQFSTIPWCRRIYSSSSRRKPIECDNNTARW